MILMAVDLIPMKYLKILDNQDKECPHSSNKIFRI